MLFRPDVADFHLIGFYTGKVLIGAGGAMAVPLVTALAAGEHNDAAAFTIGAGLALTAGLASQLALRTRARLTASHGLAIVALAWLLAPLFGAVPLLLSGHYASFLDAYFEAVSGFATVGLTIVNDVDHLSRSMNLWRHLMQFLGGQGILVVVLTIIAGGGGQVGSLYTGEGREERILPNVVRTAQFIWRVALTYALIGTTLLAAALLLSGMPLADTWFHAVTLFITAFDTAGFAPHSASAALYRSPLVEAILVVLMLAGALSFALHYQLWQGRRRELWRNIETRTLLVSVVFLFAMTAIGLGRTGTFTDFQGLFRHGFFQLVNAHTTGGLGTLPGRMFVTDWGVLAPAVLVTAMAIGGMAGSTAGGIKAIRLGVIVKGLRRDVRRLLLPEDAVVVETYHSTTRRVLRDEEVRGAVTLLLLYLVLYLGGGLLGLFFGYPFDQAMFESTAAASSGGLSVGLVRPALEWPLKVVYIAQMVVGRLEFVAVFALAGYVVAIVRGRV